jgi:AP-3 complex subunit mu
LTGTALLQPNSAYEETPDIELQWKVPLSSISGLSVASLQLVNERYKPYKGVRTIAQAGKFQIRCT